jgi:competence protein ComEC
MLTKHQNAHENAHGLLTKLLTLLLTSPILGAMMILYQKEEMKLTKLSSVLLSIALLFSLSVLPACTDGSSASNASATSDTSSSSGSSTSASTASSDMKVHFIDVGQADSILIQSNGHNMLIDGGTTDKGDTVVSYLKSQGVETLDYIIATHPHEDHIGGLDKVINAYNVKTIIAPKKETTTKTFKDFLSAVSNKGLSLTVPVTGTKYIIGDAYFIILSPNGDYGDDLNNYSVGIKLVNGSNSFIMCGDAEKESEADILKTGIDISADVLKCGHHGSDTSTSTAFLNAVNPKYAVISCGKDNDYGHPDASTLNKLAAKSVKLFRTDEQGTIVATSDGTNITWNTNSVADAAANPGKK